MQFGSVELGSLVWLDAILIITWLQLRKLANVTYTGDAFKLNTL